METFADYLKQYKADADKFLDQEFAELREHAERYEELTGQMVSDYQKLMTGGKRQRGCLIKLGYEMFNGTGAHDILQASLAIEITHTGLLIHDDVIDRSESRRGMPTLHTKYKGEFGVHNAESLAYTLGDIGFHQAIENFVQGASGVPYENFVRAQLYYMRRLMGVGFGQVLDITSEKLRKFGEEDVRAIHVLKTAEYTFSGPLAVGALLAGVNDEVVGAIEGYGVPVGIAFQIQDDELGLFGNEENTGKPNDSDVKEGKVTFLISKALELAEDEDVKFLNEVYGHRRATEEEIDRTRQIIKKCGALNYSRQVAAAEVAKGKTFIPKITSDSRYQKYLAEMADDAIKRAA